MENTGKILSVMISVDRTVHKETECNFLPGRSEVRNPLLNLLPLAIPSVAKVRSAQRSPGTAEADTLASQPLRQTLWLGAVVSVSERQRHWLHYVGCTSRPASRQGLCLGPRVRSSPTLRSMIQLTRFAVRAPPFQASSNAFSFQHADKEISCRGVSSGCTCLHMWVWKASGKRTFLSSHQGCHNIPKCHLDHDTSLNNNLSLAHPCEWGT